MDQIFLKIKRGDSKIYTIRFVEDDTQAAIDITGWTIFFTVKENVEDTDANAKIAKTITAHPNPTGGESQIELTTSDTNLIGNYLFDIQIKKDSGEIKTITEGIISFTKDVTLRTS